MVDWSDFTNLWRWTSRAAPIPPVPPSQAAHSPGNWRTADPRIRKMLLRGILRDEFESQELKELRELVELDDLTH